MNRIAKYVNPFATMAHNPLSSLVEDVFSQFWGLPTEREHYRYQETIQRDESGYTIQVVLPGVTKEQIDIELRDNVLRLTNDNRVLQEYRIPKDTDREGITAELANGILTVKVPLKTTPAVKIQVK